MTTRIPAHTVLAAALCLFAATVAVADGGFFSPYGYEIFESEQIALVRHADGVEMLDVLPVFNGPVTEFAWVVPTPSVPELDALAVALIHAPSLKALGLT